MTKKLNLIVLITILVLGCCSDVGAVTPVMVADIRNAESSYPHELSSFNGSLYFGADDGIHGKELWQWDGTSAFIVEDLSPGPYYLTGKDDKPRWTDPQDFLIHENYLYFTGLSRYYSGREIWRWDGQQAEKLTEIETVDAEGSYDPQLAGLNDAIYFSGNDTAEGDELWKWENGEAVRLTTLHPGTPNSIVSRLVNFKDELYFVGYGADIRPVQLWTWNGINATTVFDEPAGLSGGEWPLALQIVGEDLFYSATHAELGREMWMWDGENSPSVIDIFPGADSANPGSFTELNGDVYFSAIGPDTGRELWKWDGTSATMVVDIEPGPASSSPSSLTAFDNALFFTADTEEFGKELWKWDGTRARMVADIRPGSQGSAIFEFEVHNNALYFPADDGIHGRELWKLAAVPEPATGWLAEIACLLSASGVFSRNRTKRD